MLEDNTEIKMTHSEYRDLVSDRDEARRLVAMMWEDLEWYPGVGLALEALFKEKGQDWQHLLDRHR